MVSMGQVDEYKVILHQRWTRGAAPWQREILNLKVRNREVKINLRHWLEGMEMSNSLGWHTYHKHIGLPSGARKIE
jgi:hypothetical protein